MFTQNQVRQFYIAKSKQDVENLSNAGDIAVVSQGNDLYFNFVNADGEKMRTDLIGKDKIMRIIVNPASKQSRKTKAVLVTVNQNVNEGNFVGGQDYMLRVNYRRYNWPSEQTPQNKYGVVHATNTMTDAEFYKTLAKSLAANLDREGLLKVHLTTNTTVEYGTTTTEVKATTNVATLTGDYVGVVIEEIAQPYVMGKTPQRPVEFDVFSDAISVNGDDVTWGEVAKIEGSATIKNGAAIAELEWYHHGQRGDIYREAAWPTNWPNKMLADPTAEYDTIDIHYYWNGANHAIQKSEKDITIACVPGITADMVNTIMAGLPEDLEDLLVDLGDNAQDL